MTQLSQRIFSVSAATRDDRAVGVGAEVADAGVDVSLPSGVMPTSPSKPLKPAEW